MITLVTACFDTSQFNSKAVSITEGIEKIDVVLKLPVNMVIYTDDKYFNIIKDKRRGLEDKTVIIENKLEELWSMQYLAKVKENRNKYFPTKDERTSAESHCIICNKFDFVLQTIVDNPFHSNKFAWIDSFLGRDGKMRIFEDYSEEKFLSILDNVTDNFHIQVLNVNDKKFKLDVNKEEYYQKYRYVVCGGFFTCGRNIGIKILSRLKENFVHTTELGYGHGEEMLYLEILDEFYDNIIKSYGDYGQIGDNFVIITRNLNYIYQHIIKKYLDFGYNKECYDCCEKVLNGIENYSSIVSGETYLKILFSYYISSYYYKQNNTLNIVNHINDICNINEEAKQAFQNNKDYYEEQLKFASNLKKKYRLVVNIFACATVQKYKDEIVKITQTWGERAQKRGVKILFFLGEEPTDLIGDNYIYLPNVKNDYQSAAHKQNLGLKHIYENYNADFVFVCGTDTYVNIDKLLLYLDTFVNDKGLYIGGHGDHRKIMGEDLYFHSGGAGFILSKIVLDYLYHSLSTLQHRWEQLCEQRNLSQLKSACDVAIAYYIKQFQIIKSSAFKSCNYKGLCYNNTYSCCVGKSNINDIIACHHMTLLDFDNYTKLLQENNYYI